MGNITKGTRKNISTSTSPIVFINTPIHDESEDIIGFQAHVDSLQAAIDANAQMIAITSPFGAGKSSVTELLRSNRTNQRVVNVSMWSHLCKGYEKDKDVKKIGMPAQKQEQEQYSEENLTLELHKSFLYQIVSNLNSKNGSYISRRLSKNYGVLKLHTSRIETYIVAFLSLVLFIIGYILPYVFHVGIPTIWGEPEMWNSMFVLGSVVGFVYVVISSEIVFSSKNSEGKKIIDENELIELYRNFVVEYCEKQKETEKFIFVIEDLDRTDAHDQVIGFLKELRKYYILENSNAKVQNKIVFIVNVKPESSLYKEAIKHKERENESLYAKLFDFILNIQTINIDDYETVLESILQKNKSIICEIFPNNKCTRLIDIPGMQWIIWGKNFGVRDIKDRLNRAFTLYASLGSKFSFEGIEFEKCAVVAYLTTVYEYEFTKTDDRSFGQLVEKYLQHELNEDVCKTILNTNNADYIKEVISLIKSKQIDSNYRMYFYNYPRDSKIYTYDEYTIQNAILYGDAVEGKEDMVLRVTKNNISIVREAFDRLKKLKMPLPDTIFKSEALFIAALQYNPEGIYEWMSNLDYSKNGFEKSKAQILKVLNFDKDRCVYKLDNAVKYCKLWEEIIDENELLQLRHELCSNLSKEILWYKSLFINVHNIISFDELDLINICDALRLVNIKKDTFNTEHIEYFLQRFEQENIEDIVLITEIKMFLSAAEEKLGPSKVVKYLLQFMKLIKTIVPEFEKTVMDQITSKNTPTADREKLFYQYQELINLIDSKELSGDTLNNIQKLSRYDGYSENVADKLDEEGYVFEANVIRLYLNIPIDIRLEKIITANKENIDWLRKHPDIFKKLRVNVINNSDDKDIFEYDYMFDEDCPIISKEELLKMQYRYLDNTIVSLIPASIVTNDDLPILTDFFNRHFHQNSIAYNHLLYISKMDSAVAKECFYTLDFDNAIKYSTFSSERKSTIKKAFKEILNLENVENRINFMEATRYMDSAWEEDSLDTIKTNSSLQSSYITAVNKAVAKSITNSTVKTICSFNTFYALNDDVTEKLYMAKKYLHYVIGKTLRHEMFILDNNDRLENLWETYITIFSGTNYPKTRAYMESNLNFLNLIMERKCYAELSTDKRMHLSKIKQDTDSVQEAIGRGDNFAINYFQKIEGFRDKTASNAFVSAIENRSVLLASQQLYEHCHEKLRGSTIKAKYTRLRKKYGYMK